MRLARVAQKHAQLEESIPSSISSMQHAITKSRGHLPTAVIPWQTCEKENASARRKAWKWGMFAFPMGIICGMAYAWYWTPIQIDYKVVEHCDITYPAHRRVFMLADETGRPRKISREEYCESYIRKIKLCYRQMKTFKFLANRGCKQARQEIEAEEMLMAPSKWMEVIEPRNNKVMGLQSQDNYL